MTDKIKNILEQMTIEEKATMVCGASNFSTAAVPECGVPAIRMLDGGTGINYEQLIGDLILAWRQNPRDEEEAWLMKDFSATEERHVIFDYFRPDKLTEKEMKVWKKVRDHFKDQFVKNTTNNETTLAFVEMAGDAAADIMSPACFPCGMMLGATFNPDIVNMTGHALGREARAYGVHMLLGTPNINIHRDPLSGRLFEGFSEDPCLVSKLAPEYVKGVQAEGVAANIKHFAANNQEKNRQGINETISERALQEIYFPGFRACVKEGGTKSIMNAYNRINGVRCTESAWLLEEKLRKDFGFDGMVMSDWGAVLDPAKALAGGTDLAMPGPGEPQAIYDAVKAATLSEEKVDQACERVLTAIKWITENYKKEEVDKLPVDEIIKQTDEAAYEAACEGIVLLKNDAACPLAKHTKIALLGSGHAQMLECGSGSAGIDTSRHGDVAAEFARYFDVVDEAQAEYVVMIGIVPGMEGNDRKTLALADEDLAVLKRLAQAGKNVILVLNTCGPIDMREIDTDNVKAVFATFLPGMAGAKALSDMIAGEVNPSGKLTITFPERIEDMPTYMNFPGDGYHVSYGEGIYVGYRYYDKKKLRPRYPFGYGMSYTTFDCKLVDAAVDGDTIKVHTTVENTGKVAGSEVIQIYIHDPYSTLAKPEKELKAFEKVKLAPGEKKDVTFAIAIRDLASYDMDLEQFAVEEGYYDILAATSSAAENVFGETRIYLDVKSPYS